MTTKSQLQTKIQELEAELSAFKTQLNNYKEAPSIQEASVGDILDDGSIVLQKENGLAILVAPKETEVHCTWSKDFSDVFDSLKSHGFNPSQWFVPTKEQLNLAYGLIPQHFASAYYWSSTEINATNACLQSFNIGSFYSNAKTSTCCVRAFRCVTY